MNKEKGRVPKLRFPGFTEDWEQRKLIYIFNDFIVPMRDKPKIFSGTTPWTRIEDIEGRYINTSLSGQFVSDETIKSMNLKVIPKGSLIVSASATFGVVAIVNNDLITNQTFIGLVPNNDFDIDFLYSLFEAPTTKDKLLKLSAGSTIFYIARESFENLVLSVPSKAEQIKISKIFKFIDNSITLHQRKLEHLNLKKKALLQKLFPKNGERYPELRFLGFTDAWEQRKLESLFTKYEDKVKTPNSGYWRLGLRSHCKGTFHTYVDAGNELETAEMNRVQSGNFILNITFAWERALAVTNEEDQDKLVSHRFPQFKPNRDLAIDFFKHTLMDKRFKHHLELSSPGGAGRNKVLKIADMLKYELLVPSIKEQNEISSFLNNVDYIITLHQRKLEHLQLQKKALLQQMFV